MSATIEIQHLSKRFRDKIAVHDLSLRVPSGAICALLGENGAGKTTTIRVLTGQLPADQGSATVLGQDCWQRADHLRSHIGYVPERPRFYDWMTVADLGWFTSGFHTNGFLKRYQELTNKFLLNSKAELRELSKGQYAKVGLSLALALDPEVLILDEPTSGLDLLVRREFLTNMVTLAGAGRTILISSHQIIEVERIASHVVFLAGGKLLLSASMDELRQRIVRVRLRFQNQPPDAKLLGTVLECYQSGRSWQTIVLDPDRQALHELYGVDDYTDVEETCPNLEEMYCALLAEKGGKS